MMRRAGRIAAGLGLMACALWAFGPYEPVDLTPRFDAAVLGDDPSAYFATQEARYPDITPGVEKRIIWAKAPKEVTETALIYLHGFSATSEEIRPVPDRVASALGANLIYTRLRGHGRAGPAMAEARVADWMSDLDEALAVAASVGERTVILSTSTGGTLAALAALDPQRMSQVAGIVFVSPNFGINSGFAPLLTLPAARHWLPVLAGPERSFEPRVPLQARYWTTRYPSAAVFPMAALVKHAAAQDYSLATTPALFWFSMADTVVRPDITQTIAAQWGGPVTVVAAQTGPRDDPQAHVVAGDILSPGQTAAATAGILAWIEGI